MLTKQSSLPDVDTLTGFSGANRTKKVLIFIAFTNTWWRYVEVRKKTPHPQIQTAETTGFGGGEVAGKEGARRLSGASINRKRKNNGSTS